MTNTERLSASSISVTKSGRSLLDAVSLQVSRGELIGLIGPNGAGKSTLLSVLAGIDKPDGGHVSVDGQSLDSIGGSVRARKLGWLEQLSSVHWPVSVERLVMLGRIPHLPAWSKASAGDQEAVENALTLADCLSIRHQSVTTLSGGERSRALLARVLAGEPELVFADEPVSALDLSHQLQTMQLLRDFARNQQAAIVVLHDLSLAARYCDRLYLMHEGSIWASGSVASVLSPENLASVYGVSVISGCTEVPWIIPLERLDDSASAT